jgi:hypothetical protein
MNRVIVGDGDMMLLLFILFAEGRRTGCYLHLKKGPCSRERRQAGGNPTACCLLACLLACLLQYTQPGFGYRKGSEGKPASSIPPTRTFGCIAGSVLSHKQDHTRGTFPGYFGLCTQSTQYCHPDPLTFPPLDTMCWLPDQSRGHNATIIKSSGWQLSISSDLTSRDLETDASRDAKGIEESVASIKDHNPLEFCPTSGGILGAQAKIRPEEHDRDHGEGADGNRSKNSAPRKQVLSW